MNRYFWSLVLAAGLVSFTALPGLAQEGEGNGGSPFDGMGAEEQAKLVTDGELAQWLVRVLGLSRFLPAAPTDAECFQVLMQNNIVPADGWQKDRTVTMGILARVIVQSLGRQGEVPDPENDSSWITFLKEIGIDFGTIGEAMQRLEPIPQPLGQAVVVKTDPLGKKQRFNAPDEAQLGVDFAALGRIFAQVFVPGRPPPMTPN